MILKLLKLKKAQISMEYLFIMGFALILLIPVIALFFTQSSEISDSVNTNQASRIAKQLVSTAEKVYYIGEPSQTIVKIDMPENVQELAIEDNELMLKVLTSGGITDIYEVALVNITGNISTAPGKKNIRVKAQSGFVNITELLT